MSHLRCRVEPLPDHQVAFSIAGTERTRWHFGSQSPRPFFYPLAAPVSEESLTRMGHPGAPNHDHHRSVWFAHAQVLGIDFWSDNTDATIRQQQWLAYQDGDDECGMAVQLGWYDGHDPQPLVEQKLIAFLRPLSGVEPNRGGKSLKESSHGVSSDYVLEIQTTFSPRADQIEFQQTNFGFFAVRVAKNISAHFGGGQLTGSNGARTETNLFGHANRWMDYSGPTRDHQGNGPAREATIEGVTYFDHPDNVSYPSKWHVREDGWMGASVCRDRSIVITNDEPLQLRYLLHAHEGDVDPTTADKLADDFAQSPAAHVVKSTKKHTHFEIERIS